MAIRIVTADQVRALLTMPRCVEAMAAAMTAASTGQIKTPPRNIFPLLDDSAYFGVMPGSATATIGYGAKVISLHPDNPADGRPAIQGFVSLFNHHTGEPIAIIEGSQITGIRTAAASGLGTRELARPNARTHGILGTGVQAHTHIDAINAVREIERVVIWGRDSAKAQALVHDVATLYDCEVVAGTIEQATACDIVSAVTAASEPIVLTGHIGPGTHLNLVGAHTPKTREAEGALIGKAAIYVDSYESAMNEAGDLLLAEAEGHFSMSSIVGEIGEVVAGTKPARQSDQQITIYKSLGVVGQDLYAASLVYELASAQNIGTLVEL